MFEDATAQPTLLDGLAIEANNPKTRRAYQGDLLDFARFGAERKSPNATLSAAGVPQIRVPLDLDLIAAYVDHLHARGVKTSTIRRHLVAFASLHRQHRIASDPRADLKVKAAWSRVLDTEGRRADRKLAVSENAIHRIITLMDEDYQARVDAPSDLRYTLSYLRDRAILLMEYGGALTRTEVATLYVENVLARRAGLQVRVNTSGEMLGKGKRVWVNPRRTRDVMIPSHEDPDFCPVMAWKRWERKAKIVEGYAFRGVLIRGALSEGLTPRAIQDINKIHAVRAGLDENAVSSHSRRTGRLATLAYRGASDETLRERAGLAAPFSDGTGDVVSRARAYARAGKPINVV
jgi:site-specific recombinase XerD